MGRARSENGRGRNAVEMLTGKATDNVRMYLKEIGVNTRNWIDSTQDRDY